MSLHAGIEVIIMSSGTLCIYLGSREREGKK